MEYLKTRTADGAADKDAEIAIKKDMSGRIYVSTVVVKNCIGSTTTPVKRAGWFFNETPYYHM